MYRRIARLVGLLLGGVLGWEVAFWIPGVPQVWTRVEFLRWGVPLALVGAAIGYLVFPYITIRPAQAAISWLRNVPLTDLLAGSAGLLVGLVISAILAIPLSRLPSPFGPILPLIGAIIFAYLGIVAAVLRYHDILELWRQRGFRLSGKSSDKQWGPMPVLLDTSVIIDGRIADIVRTGFIPGPLLVPRFVLNELQYIADSDDSLRRNRGRRGLEILHELQEGRWVELKIIEDDVNEVRQVDEKLLRLAKRLGCPILTNDYNLNRVATLQDVAVLNVNELANAVKTVLLPGESLDIHLIQEGKEPGQGVGYLDDGTMVVVQDGKRFIGQTVRVTVTKVLQTSAGRMIFATPEEHRASQAA